MLVEPASAKTPTPTRFELVATYVLACSALVIAGLMLLRAISERTPDPVDKWGISDPLLDSVGAFSHELADSTSNVRIVEFVDLECSACAHYHRSVIAPLLREKPSMSFSFRVVHFPLDIHPFARAAAVGAECAREQGRMGSFVELAMQRQRSFADEIWVDIAFDAGVADTAAFSTCIRSSRNDGRIERGKALAREIGAQGTPAIAVNGRLAGILPTLDELREIVGRPVASAPEI